MSKNIKAFLTMIIILLPAAGLSFAAGQNSATYLNFPLFAAGVIIAFVIQWIAFIPAFIMQTEKFYDLTGSISYISIMIVMFILSPVRDERCILVMSMVIIWALRLGTFLFRRIHRAGKDSRFDEIKKSFTRFLIAWTLQGLWISFTLAAALATMTSITRKEPGVFAVAGLLIWILGFATEAVADLQKNRFRADSSNRGKFIRTGLWSRSRHPNYFGEITLWVGIAVIAVPVLQGWMWVSLVSPIFVAFLITKISGVPMLEKKADETWGGQEDYEEYKKNTPVLIPRIF